MSKPSHETARVHLTVLGQTRPVDVRVRRGPARLVDLLRPARALTEAVVKASIEYVEAAGQSVSCTKGCAACCRHLVPVSLVEAVALAKLVDSMPRAQRDRVRSRFNEALARLESRGLLPKGMRGRAAFIGKARDPKALWDEVSRAYFAAQIPCPFLEAESCSIYEERPVVCREYLVTTPPSGCDEIGDHVAAVPRPLRMNEVLGAVVDEFTDLGNRGIPLVLALEWAEAYGAELAAEYDGTTLLQALVVHGAVADD